MRALCLLLCLVTPSVARAYECAVDPALEEVAVRIATEARGFEDGALRELVRAAGGSMPVVRSLRAPLAEPDAVERFLTTLRATSEGPVVCGEAESEGERVLVAGERAGHLELVRGETDRIKASLTEGFTAQYLVFQGADGRFVRVAPTRALAEGEPVPESVVAPYTVQLVAEARRGPRPVAELAVGTPEAAEERAARTIARRRGDEAPGLRVARLRTEASASPLRPNRLLDEAAQAYAMQVCSGGRVAHRTTTGEGPRERLRQRGIDARVVGETIARATSRAEALAALEGSASHLATLVDRRFTDGGYGIATDAQGRRCVVVVLAAWPRAIVSR